MTQPCEFHISHAKQMNFIQMRISCLYKVRCGCGVSGVELGVGHTHGAWQALARLEQHQGCHVIRHSLEQTYLHVKPK